MDKTNREIAIALGEALGFNIFSSDYDILVLLHETETASHKDLASCLSPSSATLDRRLNVLRCKGLVDAAVDGVDQRRRNFALTPEARQILDEELSLFCTWRASQPDASAALQGMIGRLQSRLRMKIFDPRYGLMVSAYRNDGVRTLPLRELAQVSQGTFFNKLRELKETGVVDSVRDSDDGREVRVYLSKWALRAMDDANGDMIKWALNCVREEAG